MITARALDLIVYALVGVVTVGFFVFLVVLLWWRDGDPGGTKLDRRP